MIKALNIDEAWRSICAGFCITAPLSIAQRLRRIFWYPFLDVYWAIQFNYRKLKNFYNASHHGLCICGIGTGGHIYLAARNNPRAMICSIELAQAPAHIKLTVQQETRNIKHASILIQFENNECALYRERAPVYVLAGLKKNITDITWEPKND
jgi:hypothetical protein